MDNHKDDQYYAKKAIEDITAIEAYIKGKTYEEFVDDGLLMDAVMFRLIQLIENIKKISFLLKRLIRRFRGVRLLAFATASFTNTA